MIDTIELNKGEYMEKELVYQRVLEEAKQDPNVLGFILGGGRGKGLATEHSDYDIIMVVPDEKKTEYETRYETEDLKKKEVDIGIWPLSDFKKYGTWHDESAGHAYNFAHLQAAVDRTGEIQQLINEKAKIPETEIHKFVNGELDKFINYYYRAVKNHRDGSELASHLDAAESMPVLISLFFALEGKVRPYNKHLEWELKNFPLEKLPWSPEEFLKIVNTIVTTGDIELLKQTYNKVYEVFDREGFKEILDGWNGYYGMITRPKAEGSGR